MELLHRSHTLHRIRCRRHIRELCRLFSSGVPNFTFSLSHTHTHTNTHTHTHTHTQVQRAPLTNFRHSLSKGSGLLSWGQGVRVWLVFLWRAWAAPRLHSPIRPKSYLCCGKMCGVSWKRRRNYQWVCYRRTVQQEAGESMWKNSIGWMKLRFEGTPRIQALTS